MILKKIKARHLFWIVSILIVIIGFYKENNPNSTLDINIHDTYFVISNYDCTLVLFTLYFLTGLLYWLFEYLPQKQLLKPLTFIHTTILIGSFIIYWLVILYSKIVILRNPFPLFDNYLLINSTLIIEFLLIIFVAIPTFLINLLIGLFRKV
jgi:heme/copper-type cytochrome/quinol oxidase subunit 1